MTTILKITEDDFDAGIDVAVALMKTGGILVYPTDTVYGIGGEATSDDVVRRIHQIKGVTDKRPMSVMVSDFGMIEYFCETGVWEDMILGKYLPGPYTFVLKRSRRYIAASPSEKLGVRIPESAFCQALTYSMLNVAGSDLSGNSGFDGGAIFGNGFSGNTTVNVHTTTIAGNSGQEAGGIYSQGGGGQTELEGFHESKDLIAAGADARAHEDHRDVRVVAERAAVRRHRVRHHPVRLGNELNIRAALLVEPVEHALSRPVGRNRAAL